MQEAKPREGNKVKAKGGCVQVLAINTPGADEDGRRKLREEIVFLMTWNPKELDWLLYRCDPC